MPLIIKGKHLRHLTQLSGTKWKAVVIWLLNHLIDMSENKHFIDRRWLQRKVIFHLNSQILPFLLPFVFQWGENIMLRKQNHSALDHLLHYFCPHSYLLIAIFLTTVICWGFQHWIASKLFLLSVSLTSVVTAFQKHWLIERRLLNSWTILVFNYRCRRYSDLMQCSDNPCAEKSPQSYLSVNQE